MSWKWEYAFGAEEAARTAPADFLRSERVHIVQITHLGF